MDTIVAVSSGRPPAAIAIVRVSGPEAVAAAGALAGALPPPRRAALRALRRSHGGLLDRALVLVFPGPDSATGEDLVEFHCHGGRAVVAAVMAALVERPGLRFAQPGEFTRRALTNGRIDLAQAEGLADLLQAETEDQRRAALYASEGRLSSVIHGWMNECARLSAQIEVLLDYAEEGDAGVEAGLLDSALADAAALRARIEAVLAAPPVERLRDGIRVVIAGPPNAGKSTLFNLLSARDAAIVSPQAGTTRDRIEAPVVHGGRAWLLIDSAGLNDAIDVVEQIGVARAWEAIETADVVLWLGDEPPPRADAIWLHARADLPERRIVPASRDLAVRHDMPEAIEHVWRALLICSETLLPKADDLPLKAAQRVSCKAAAVALDLEDDLLIAAEQLRIAHRSLARIVGLDATESMLDNLFGRFCLGK
ncbi:tRNA uridine-5-carboxymethylaminomethyl(34) synthesis GTPase MnmE [Sphingomonas sp.]|uniref:tRNA uridine-5-carboxymethylaminomethyl(34) synthesis GTPase MnmE n=1 Tax=Sphingomonas sp. TaxID=28214 RepID=UPI003CC5CAD8